MTLTQATRVQFPLRPMQVTAGGAKLFQCSSKYLILHDRVSELSNKECTMIKGWRVTTNEKVQQSKDMQRSLLRVVTCK